MQISISTVLNDLNLSKGRLTVYDYLKSREGEWVCSMDNPLPYGHQVMLSLRGLPGIEVERMPKPRSTTNSKCIWMRYVAPTEDPTHEEPLGVIEFLDSMIQQIEEMKAKLA